MHAGSWQRRVAALALRRRPATREQRGSPSGGQPHHIAAAPVCVLQPEPAELRGALEQMPERRSVGRRQLTRRHRLFRPAPTDAQGHRGDERGASWRPRRGHVGARGRGTAPVARATPGSARRARTGRGAPSPGRKTLAAGSAAPVLFFSSAQMRGWHSLMAGNCVPRSACFSNGKQ